MQKEKLRQKNLFFVGILKATEEKEHDPDPIPGVRIPRIRLRVKKARIQEGYRKVFSVYYGYLMNRRPSLSAGS
jgi:hypothetical protein